VQGHISVRDMGMAWAKRGPATAVTPGGVKGHGERLGRADYCTSFVSVRRIASLTAML